MSPKVPRVNVVQSYDALRSRVRRLFAKPSASSHAGQLPLPLHLPMREVVEVPTASLAGFLDFLATALPSSEIYLFGGVLRDMALLGREGFNSDIDIVVEGDWSSFANYLDEIGAKKNKFGGYRLSAGAWPIDIWNAKETWAIREGLVPYSGIQSLTKTTVLNWDAILMDWRSKRFVCEEGYLLALHDRALDIVLQENPNPRGMAVRVFRHLSLREARRLTRGAAAYLEACTQRYSFRELADAEMSSYGNSVIEPVLYRFFSCSRSCDGDTVDERVDRAVASLEREGVAPKWKQLDLRIQTEFPT